MPLIFLPLLALTTAGDAGEVYCGFEEVDMGSKTCHNSQRIAKEWVDLATCKGDCEADGDCTHIHWQSAAQIGKTLDKCNRYRSCTSFRTTSNPGTNYQYRCRTLGPDHEVLQGALDATGCTSGVYTDDAPTDTTAWESMLTSQNTQQLFEDLYDTCYHAKRGTASEAEEYQCCGEAAVDVHKQSVAHAEANGGVVIHTCGPQASMVPFAGIMGVSSNPPECKRLFNFQCEQFTFREKVARALRATGCPNREPDWEEIDEWERFGYSDLKIWGRLYDPCHVVKYGIGGASTQRSGKDFCCGVGEECMPTHCTEQTSWDCGEPSCPIMENTGFSGATGIWAHVEASQYDCQSMCQIMSECNSWTWKGALCQLYSDTVSTSSTTTQSGWYSGYKCAKTYNCVQGQGQSGASYAKYDYNTEAECAAKCHEEAGNLKLGTTNRKAYTCVNGQGASGQSKQSTSANNRDTCANICNSNSQCVGFDWTKNKQGDSCRIYYTTSNARVDNAGSDHRQWCYQVTNPCIGFDFTKTAMSNACRLYRGNTNPRIGNEGNDERMWCPEHTGGFLPEAEFDCDAASLDGTTMLTKTDESPEECARQCATDPGCSGFDLTFQDMDVTCRRMTYSEDHGNLGNSGGAARRFCRRITHSERQNDFCDGLPEDYCDDAHECRFVDGQCTIEDTIWCRNGRISDNTGKWDNYYESYNTDTARLCWDKCLASPQCFGYEYKMNSGDHNNDGKAVGTCYLYDALEIVDSTSRYVYEPGCPEGPDGGFGCNDLQWKDNGWKYCKRHVSGDMGYLHSSAVQYWAPERP